MEADVDPSRVVILHVVEVDAAELIEIHPARIVLAVTSLRHRHRDGVPAARPMLPEVGENVSQSIEAPGIRLKALPVTVKFTVCVDRLVSVTVCDRTGGWIAIAVRRRKLKSVRQNVR